MRAIRCMAWVAALAIPSIAVSTTTADLNDNVVTTATHKFTEIRNGIWLAQSTAAVFNSNALVIVNEHDVVIVDSHVTPAKARDLIRSIQAITNHPISTLINSHHHWDHAHGNQEFSGIPIIGHEFTYEKLAGAPLEEATYRNGVEGNDAVLKRLHNELEGVTDPKRKQELTDYLKLLSAHAKDFNEIDPVPPTITFNERMTLHRGAREIQILFLGRAHTGGDVLVYFPNERLLFTGDVAFSGPSYLGDGYVDEWPHTLEKMKALDFDVFIPGHGGLVSDLARIDLVQDFYRDLWAKATALYAQGVDVETAAQTIDLTNHTNIPIKEVGVSKTTMRRLYHRLEHP